MFSIVNSAQYLNAKVENAGHVHNKNAKQACLLFASCMLLVREVVAMRSQNTNLMFLRTIQVTDRNRESSCYRTLYFSTNILLESQQFTINSQYDQ